MNIESDSIRSRQETVPTSVDHVGSVADESIGDREDWSFARSNTSDASDGLVDFQIATTKN